MELFFCYNFGHTRIFGNFWGTQIVRVEQWLKKACGYFSLSYFGIMNHLHPFCGNLANSSEKLVSGKQPLLLISIHQVYPPPNLQLPSKSGRTSYIFPGTHFHGSHVFCWFFPAEPFCWRFFQGQRLRTHRPLESSVLLRWDITQNSQVEMSVVDFEYGLVPWMVLEMNVPCRRPPAEGHAVHDGSFGWSGSPRFRSAHLSA